jgi:hypothetical protein
MTMRRARVVTPWSGSGTAAAPFVPKLLTAYALAWHQDVTGQPAASLVPSPNAYTVEIVCLDTVLSQIEADSTYSVLWSETT